MSCRTVVLGSVVCCLAGSAQLAAAPPRITRFEPLALAPGQTVELRFSGQNLKDVRSLWTTFDARCEFLPAGDESQQKGESFLCRVTVPREEQVGIGALRIVTGEGVSNPLLVMLDDLSSIAEVADNHAAEQAQPLAWPTAVDGQCDAVQEDWFRFHAVAGTRIAFEVVSQRMGSKLDPIARLLTADGNEIAQLDDVDGVGGDIRFAHTFATDGDYLLVLRDVRYAGGTDYRYRLRIGTFPLVRAAYPGGGPSGAVMTFHPLGQENNELSALHVKLPPVTDRTRLVSFGVPGYTPSGSGWFQVEAANCPETAEAEPNDSPTEATPAVVPGMLNGRLDKVGDRDYFKFTAKKGQRLHCIAKTRELGSECDLFIRLLKGDGSQVAQARQERQTVLDAEVPDDGEYELVVEDLLVGAPPGPAYRIDVSDAYSGFAINAENSEYSAPQGGTFLVKVLSQRRGYNGPIELAVEGLGDGVSLEGNKLDGAETVLKITLPATIAQGEFRHAVLVGKAVVNEQPVTVPMNQREQLRALFSNVLSMPTQLESTIAVGIGPPFPPFFELSLANKLVYFPQLVGTSTFDIQIQRTNMSFKDAVAVSVDGLPPGVTAEVAPVDDGSKAVRVTLKGPADLTAGDHTIHIVGTGKFQDQTRTVEIRDVTLRVSPPLVVSLSMAGPVVAGRQQNAVVSLQRFDTNPQPVRLQFSGGPAGLLAPIAVTIPAEVNEMKVPLAAVETAAAGASKDLIVVASTMVNDQNVTVQSSPATVEIQSAPAK